MGSTGPILVEQEKKRRQHSRLVLILRVIPLAIAGVLCYHFIVFPLFVSGFGNADTRPVPGDASNFDPVGALPGVTAYAGDGAQLISIDAEYVRSDGTMELTATYSPAPSVEYKFVHKVPRPDNAAPVGAGGANTGDWYEPITIDASQPGKWWSVSKTSGNVTTKYSYMNQGMERETSTPENGLDSEIVPAPACSFAELWKVALKKDAPKDAVATIEYDQNGYRFNIIGLGYDLDFDTKCQVKS